MLGVDDAVTVCCAWASGPDQEAELERQQSVMSAHCSAMGCRVLTLCDASGDGVGPGMRDLLEMIVRRRLQRLVVVDGQHLSRFSAGVVITLCELQGVDVVIAQQVDEPVVEPDVDQRMEIEPLPDDVLDDAAPEGVDGTWQPSRSG